MRRVAVRTGNNIRGAARARLNQRDWTAMRFRFTIVSLIVIAALVGLAIAFDVDGSILVVLLFIVFAPSLIVVAQYIRVRALEASAGHWAQRGAARYRAGDLAAAECDLTKALELDPSLKVARANRGCTRLSLGKFREAVDDLERLRCEGSDDSRIALYRGHAHELLGEWEYAVRDYALASELSPSETAAGILLARLQAGCPVREVRDGSKAVDNAYRMCVRTEWKDWKAVSVLAAAHAEGGNFEAAVQFAEKAHDLAPDPEKAERQRRIQQFKAGIPFRLSQTGQFAGTPMEIDATLATTSAAGFRAF